MTEQEQLVTRRRRRTRVEVARLVKEFKESGMNRSQFCRQQNPTLSTLKRNLERRPVAATDRSHPWRSGLVPVEVIEGHRQREKLGKGSGLAIVLAGGRRIEVLNPILTRRP